MTEYAKLSGNHIIIFSEIEEGDHFKFIRKLKDQYMVCEQLQRGRVDFKDSAFVCII